MWHSTIHFFDTRTSYSYEFCFLIRTLPYLIREIQGEGVRSQIIHTLYSDITYYLHRYYTLPSHILYTIYTDITYYLHRYYLLSRQILRTIYTDITYYLRSYYILSKQILYTIFLLTAT